MSENTLKELFIDELRDLYDAENRLVKAIPKIAKACSSNELRSGFEHHLEQTKGHVDRLRQILTSLEEKPVGKKCPGMTGIIREGEETMNEDYEGGVRDAAIISIAQRVEHYEIAAYGCVRAWAEGLGEREAAALLEKTLNEEKETDAKLTELAEQINASALSESSTTEDQEEQAEEAPRKGKSKAANA